MMNRTDVGKKLKTFCNNIYFQSPDGTHINYPAICYTRNRIDITYADDIKYLLNNQYMLTVISKDPDCEIGDNLLNSLDYIQFDRQYVYDGLYHWVYLLTI